MAACRADDCQSKTVNQEANQKKKIIQTVFLLGIYCLFGLVRGQEGLAFLDLISLTNSDITNGSMMFTMSALGYAVGALFIGILYDKLNNDILYGLCAILVGIFTLLIPWCGSLPLMVTLCSLRALFQGPVDSGSSILCAKVWLLKAAPVLQALQFLFAIGGILSPFVTEPFLLTANNNTMVAVSSHAFNFRNAASDLTLSEIKPFSLANEFFITTERKNQIKSPEQNSSKLYHIDGSTSNTTKTPVNSTSWTSKEKSRVYIAFTISGSAVIVVAVLFSVKTMVYSSGDFDRFQTANRTGDQIFERNDSLNNSPIVIKALSCTLLAMNCFAYGCVEKIYMMFLMTFAVEYLGWSKRDGSIANGIFWAGFAAGRLAAIIITNFLRPRNIMVLNLLALIVTQGLMLAVEYLNVSDDCWWVLFGSSGFFIGPLFATTVSWVDLNLTPVRGKIMSFMFVWMFIGTTTHLYLLGYLFEHSSPIWFVYLLLAYTILALISFLGVHFTIIYQPSVIINTEEEVVAPLQKQETILNSSANTVNN